MTDQDSGLKMDINSNSTPSQSNDTGLTPDQQAIVAQEPIVEIQVNGSVITLLGTAHVSRASADKVVELLESGRFDSVAVELCKSRHNSIIDPDAFARMDLFQVIREGKAAMVTANLALGAFQQRMAEQLDIKPGAEMRAAIDTAAEKNLPVLLIDREIATTLKRVYRNVPWWQRFNLLAGLIASVVSRQEVSEEEIERLKEGDILESAFTQFAEQQHDLFVPLVDERDRYMASRLLQESQHGEHKNILVVIGAGHMKGIEAYLKRWLKIDDDIMPANERPQKQLSQKQGESAVRQYYFEDPFPGADVTIEALDHIPPASRWPKLIPWFIVGLIFIGFIIGFSKSSTLGMQMVIDWVLINGGLAAIGALIAWAHPVTIVAAFVAAPLTSLNPAIGAGMVTAAVEIMMRRPKVDDFSRLRTEAAHIKGWWHNRVTRTLLVFILSTLGSAIGTYVAGFRIFERLTS